MTAYASLSRLRGLASTAYRRNFARTVARTAAFNITAAVVAGLGGLIIARSLGPTARGEYAAVTAWFGVALMVGGMGQPAALCFYVARDAQRAPAYVATSRAMMLVTGSVALCAGLLLAPVLAHGHTAMLNGYRIAFAASIMAFVGASYTFSLQARNLHQWNIVRITQPVLSFTGVAILWRLHVLTVDTALVVLSGTMLLQLAWAYGCCRQAGLVPGHAQMTLARPLVTYGAAQIAALTPAALNAQLDQLVLSQTVPAADLGRYAVAVSLSLFPIPLVSAIGNVAFPRLAAQSEMTQVSWRLLKASVTGSFVISAGLIVPFAAVAYWVVPLVFGPAYREAVPLLWILAPGSVFFASNQVVGDLLRGRGQPGTVAWAQGLAAVFTVVLLLALLPFMGVYGAAIASTIAYGVALAAMLQCLRRQPPRHSHGERRKRSPWSADLIPIQKEVILMAGGRTAVSAATDAMCHAVGGRRVVRAARFIHRRACLDGPNDMDTNGEIWLQHQVVGMSLPTERILVLDVGASVGHWSSAMLSAASQAGRLDDLDLHAFEPSAYTFAQLSEALDSCRVTLSRMALGDQSGLSTLHVIAPGAGTNSLYESPLAGATVGTEAVQTTTLDNYAKCAGLGGGITLVKLDTEGHDLAVLRGAQSLLAGQQITVLQFEYNQRWIFARAFLRDAFELLVPLGYSIGKLTWRGVEFYSRWDVNLESFVEANYVACTPWAATRIPSVQW